MPVKTSVIVFIDGRLKLFAHVEGLSGNSDANLGTSVGSVANISLNTIYGGSFKNKTTTDSGFKNIYDRTFLTRSFSNLPYNGQIGLDFGFEAWT
jgi:hypothetical protein